MTVIYTMVDDDGEERAFSSLAEARRIRAQDYNMGNRPSITRVVVAKMPLRELLCAVYERHGFAKEQTTALEAC